MRSLAILALFMLAGCAVAPYQSSPHNDAHRLEFKGGICSSVAVGPHTLLSAQHCFAGEDSLKVDGVPVAVTEIISDGADHVLVIVSATFHSFARIGPAPSVGDHIQYWGNPAALYDVYREGYVCGTAVEKNHLFLLLDIQGFYGDSGAGIFNASGHLVGVVSLLYQNTDRGYMKFMGAFPMKFTAEQWAKVQ